MGSGRAARCGDRGLSRLGGSGDGSQERHEAGEILRDEIEAAGVSEEELSRALDIPLDHVTMILTGQQGIAADTALRLARYFGTTPELWLNLQQTWELRRAEIEVGRKIAKRVLPRQSAA